MATTTNFGWSTPDDTAYVKDGASAMRTLGSAIDSSMMDLKGGTTNQVMAKNSNTDMDFKWVSTIPFVGCGLKRTTAQSINNATWTTIDWSAEDFDTNAFHSTTTNTSRITVPSSFGGKYHFNGTIRFPANTTGIRAVRLILNGDTTSTNTFDLALSNASDLVQIGLSFSITLDLVATDYVQIQVYQNQGVSQNVETISRFIGQYLGA